MVLSRRCRPAAQFGEVAGLAISFFTGA